MGLKLDLTKKLWGFCSDSTKCLITILGSMEEANDQNILTIRGLWHCLVDYSTLRTEIKYMSGLLKSHLICV